MSLEHSAVEDGSKELKRIMLFTVAWCTFVVVVGVLLVLYSDAFTGSLF